MQRHAGRVEGLLLPSPGEEMQTRVRGPHCIRKAFLLRDFARADCRGEEPIIVRQEHEMNGSIEAQRPAKSC